MPTANEILSVGATITELAQLFGRDRKEIRERIGDMPPRGHREKLEIWRVRDVAPRLVKMDGSTTDMVRRILETHHTDLPKMLSKEFWYGQNQRLNYLIRVGDLWDTGAVIDLCSAVFKTMRLSLMLAQDAVERETRLTDKQRQIIENLMHEALKDMREKLVVSLSEAREDTRGKAFAPSEESDGDRGVAYDEWGGFGPPDDEPGKRKKVRSA